MTLTRRIEDFAIVTLITLLIWFYAESNTVDQYSPTTSGPVPLQLRSASKDMILVGPSAGSVTVLEFSGSRYAIGRLRPLLVGGLKLDVTLTEPGPQRLSLARLVADQFGHLNVSLTRIEPDAVELTAVRKVAREAELVFRPEEVKLQDGEYDIEPATVRITLPEDRLADVMSDGKIVLSVQPSREADRNLRKLPVNQKVTIPARVELPAVLQDNPHVQVAPAEVMLSFIIEKREVSHVLNLVPVTINLPPAELRNFDPQIHEEDQFLKDVKVTGPAEIIEQIKSGAITLDARVKFTRDTLVDGAKKGESTYAVKFVDLPPGVSVESPKSTIRATIVRLNP